MTCRFSFNASEFAFAMTELLNGSQNANDGVRYLSRSESYLVVVLYTTISLTAIIGNSCVVFIIANFRRMRETPTNLLIANLAIADLLMAFLCVPFSYWPTLILQCWPFGKLMCKVIYFLQAVTVFLSAYTLVAMSIDRFLAIMFPLRPNMKLTTTRAKIVIGVVWMVSIFIATPLLVVLEVGSFDDSSLQCVENWKNLPFLGLSEYGMSILIIQYFFPLFVLTVTYAGIGARIWFSKMPGGEESKSRQSAATKDRRDSVRKVKAEQSPVNYAKNLKISPRKSKKSVLHNDLSSANDLAAAVNISVY